LGFRSGVGGARVADHSPLLARIRAEETSLPTQFDGEYDICCARTSLLIPRNYEDQRRLASTFEMLFDSRRDEGRADGRFGPMGERARVAQAQSLRPVSG